MMNNQKATKIISPDLLDQANRMKDQIDRISANMDQIKELIVKHPKKELTIMNLWIIYPLMFVLGYITRYFIN